MDGRPRRHDRLAYVGRRDTLRSRRAWRGGHSADGAYVYPPPHPFSLTPVGAGMYKGGHFKFTFNINQNYPHEPPKVKCTQKVPSNQRRPLVAGCAA